MSHRIMRLLIVALLVRKSLVCSIGEKVPKGQPETAETRVQAASAHETAQDNRGRPIYQSGTG